MTCPSAEELRSFSLGQLPEEECDSLFDHLRTCQSCRSELETIGDEEDSLIASLRAAPTPAIDDEPDCKRAVAKALGALADAADKPISAESSFLPQSIGEYEIVRPLGQGGMGNVYLARHTKLGREVAIKVLTQSRLAAKQARDRFAVEMQAIGRLSHPNIVTAHDAREVDGLAVLVMEYIDGLDLSQIVARTGPLPTAEACEIIRQVAVALQYTNDQGFVHRDVKPSNIMLSRGGEVKLLDLGLARLQQLPQGSIEITATGQAMGTADYVAPEQVNNSRDVDGRADIYALGCTLFKLLTGAPPFANEDYPTTFAKMTAHTSTPPPSLHDRLPGSPPALARLIDSMLAKEPEQRPQSPREVAERLSRFCTGAELSELVNRAIALPERITSARPATTPVTNPRTQSWFRRPVTTATAAGIGFGGLILGICLGVLITIKFPDGSTVAIEGPDGTEVQVDSSTAKQTAKEPMDNVLGTQMAVPKNPPIAITPAENRADIASPFPPESEPFAPLQFAVLLEEDEVDQEALNAARRLMGRVGQVSAMTTPQKESLFASDIGAWFPVDANVTAPIAETADGKRYALASDDDARRISWGEIRGHIVGTDASFVGGPRGHQVQIEFDETLIQRFKDLTRDNLGASLGIIVAGRIVTTPKIAAEVGSRMTITGLNSDQHQLLTSVLAAAAIGRAEQFQTESADQIADMAVQPPQHSSAAFVKIKNDLKAIGAAFHNFHDVYAKLPGPANTREGGATSKDKPTYPFSWRVAILPFVEGNELYEAYRFDEPWDSEANSKLLDKMPDVFRHPIFSRTQPAGHTNYLGVASPESALGTGGGIPIREIRDGTSNTLLVMESQQSVPWTKPQDIEGQAELLVGKPTQFLMVDGSVRELDRRNNDQVWLQKAITRAGGEVLEFLK